MRRFFRRQPDFTIGDPTNPYMRRWWIIPRNRFFNIYLHNIMRDDDDRALHDHPWINVSIVLAGGYFEHTAKRVKWRRAGSVVVRRPKASHRLSLAIDAHGNPRSAWTLFFTGPRVRVWGFHCPQGWVAWHLFTSTDGQRTGKGCNQ